MSKQDRQGVRTAMGLEQKYNFGESFAEIMGIATDARDSAEELEENLKNTMTAEQIFNVLTNNGANQGLYRGPDGEIYINAEFIKAVDAIFARDINMSGKFTYKTTTFLEPEQEEIDTIKKHILEISTIPSNKIALYDFNNDGVVDIVDAVAAKRAIWGEISLASWSGAKKTDVTITIDLTNPEKAIRMTGTNMWGRAIERYIGMGTSSLKLPEVAQARVVTGSVVASFDGAVVDLFTISDIAQMFLNKYGIGYKDIDLYNLGVSLINGDANAAYGYTVTGQWKGDTLQAVLSTGLTGSYRINYAFTAYF